MRQDKLFKLRQPQLRGKGAPTLVSSHSDPPESWTLPGWVVQPENLGPSRVADKFTGLEKPATSCKCIFYSVNPQHPYSSVGIWGWRHIIPMLNPSARQREVE